MSFLFNRSKPKTPQDLAKSLNEVLHRLDTTASITERKKLVDDTSKLLSQIAVLLCGDQGMPFIDMFHYKICLSLIQAHFNFRIPVTNPASLPFVLSFR